MTKEKISDYTLRISQANRSEIVVILYDMALTYIEDAINAIDNKDHEGLRKNCGYASKVVSDLIGSLSYDNELSLSLRSCYTYILTLLQTSVYKNRRDELLLSSKMLKNLQDAFKEIAKKDTSSPLMGNSQNVYAGLTYGKSAVYDNLTTEVNRGYKA